MKLFDSVDLIKLAHRLRVASDNDIFVEQVEDRQTISFRWADELATIRMELRQGQGGPEERS